MFDAPGTHGSLEPTPNAPGPSTSVGTTSDKTGTCPMGASLVLSTPTGVSTKHHGASDVPTGLGTEMRSNSRRALPLGSVKSVLSGPTTPGRGTETVGTIALKITVKRPEGKETVSVTGSETVTVCAGAPVAPITLLRSVNTVLVMAACLAVPRISSSSTGSSIHAAPMPTDCKSDK